MEQICPIWRSLIYCEAMWTKVQLLLLGFLVTSWTNVMTQCCLSGYPGHPISQSYASSVRLLQCLLYISFVQIFLF